eukprot:CAMPEP_0119262642 /NCGR_PEP_ID=MMETSP1329-20130426/2296_1 /TAXON_ID=114041 /ORGANISM="Genus nov. species nov., Strain RCC1024" /LENGTH=540 /DNA_ID=CAMNT_0007262305 /DNA_START=96 /DNA_END=1718 /DNA_ORIENTATION=-
MMATRIILTALALVARATAQSSTPVVAGLGLSAEPAAPVEAALSEEKGAGWWGDAPAVGEATETATSALARMNALLRRQLDEGDAVVFSYDTEGPSTMPTPLPTPIPTTLETDPCPEGTFSYELALYDYQGDGWEGAEYVLSQFEGFNPDPEEVARGTLASGSEQIESFCLEDGTYSVEFGGGSDDAETGIQWLPDDKQKITSCRGPCTDYFMMVGGLVLEPTAPPTPINFNKPTSFDASQTTWLLTSVDVGGVSENAFTPDETASNVISNAINDVWLTPDGDNRLENGPEDVLDSTVTILERRRKLLQNDKRAQIDLTVLMDTCAQAGFTSNDECLASFVTAIDESAASGQLAERLNYWAAFFGLPGFPDITVDGVVPDTPEWVFAPTPAPTSAGGPSPAPTPTDDLPPTVPGAPTPAPTARPTSSSKKKKKKQGLSSGELIATIVCCILAVLICLLCCLYFKQRERKATERKDSWDISTMFTDEQNLPAEGDPPAAIEGDPDAGVVALADDADDAAGAAAAVAEEPQALQKITQAAEL